MDTIIMPDYRINPIINNELKQYDSHLWVKYLLVSGEFVPILIAIIILFFTNIKLYSKIILIILLIITLICIMINNLDINVTKFLN